MELEQNLDHLKLEVSLLQNMKELLKPKCQLRFFTAKCVMEPQDAG